MTYYKNPDWLCIHQVVHHQCTKCKEPSLDRPAPTRVEQQELSRTTINELGAAIGRIEQKQTALRDEIWQAYHAGRNDREGFEAQLVQRMNAIEREIHLIDGTLGINYYPHMCRDGHQQIGHRDSEHEMCPLCREIAKNRAKQRPARQKRSPRKGKRK